MMWWDIDYELLNEAKAYYVGHGFKYIEVPWIVSPGAYNATAPVNGHIAKNGIIVASGEQSFMQLVLDGLLTAGRYCCITPCFRPWDLNRSREHLTQFVKMELIQYEMRDYKENADFYEESYEFLKDKAINFLSSKVAGAEVIKTQDDPRLECTTIISHDVQTSWGLELGSYGIRSHPAIGYWIYGTGVALPRLTSAIAQLAKRA